MSDCIVQRVSADNQEINNPSNGECYICFDNTGDLMFPCKCKGTNKGVHSDCLEKWIYISTHNYCLVCKYIYMYKLVYNPSFVRFVNSCINFRKLKFSNNINILLITLIIVWLNITGLSTILIFIPDLRLDYILPIFSVLQLLQLYVISKIDNTFNLISMCKYSQLFLSSVMCLFIVIKLDYSYTYCTLNCETKNTICDNECSSYIKYIAQKAINVNALIYQGVIFVIIILFDIYIKIKKAIYSLSIMPYNIRAPVLASGNQIMPYIDTPSTRANDNQIVPYIITPSVRVSSTHIVPYNY